MSDLEKALALIEKEKLEKTGELDLRGYDLTELPKEIKELVWLQKLDCSITKKYLVEYLNKIKISINQFNEQNCLMPINLKQTLTAVMLKNRSYC